MDQKGRIVFKRRAKIACTKPLNDVNKSETLIEVTTVVNFAAQKNEMRKD